LFLVHAVTTSTSTSKLALTNDFISTKDSFLIERISRH